MIAGKEKGKRGKVLTVLPKEGKIVIEGLHLVKKHRRPRRTGEKGETVQVPRAVPVSKVKLVCPKCGSPTRVGYRVSGKTKVRICKKCESEI